MQCALVKSFSEATGKEAGENLRGYYVRVLMGLTVSRKTAKKLSRYA